MPSIGSYHNKLICVLKSNPSIAHPAMSEDTPVVFSCAYITPETRLEFEELLGKGEVKSSQPKRKAEGEIEDSPIEPSYPLKVPDGATEEDMRKLAVCQRAGAHSEAVRLLCEDVEYVDLVIRAHMKNDECDVVRVCLACKRNFETWNYGIDMCNSCEDAFLALTTEAEE